MEKINDYHEARQVRRMKARSKGRKEELQVPVRGRLRIQARFTDCGEKGWGCGTGGTSNDTAIVGMPTGQSIHHGANAIARTSVISNGID